MTVAAVVIGRNEGERLIACLQSLKGEVTRVVYVDSGSTDDSAARAAAMGVDVVPLDMAVPFTAARARNAGFDRLAADGLPDFVQFVDGDCRVEPGWIAAATAFLDQWPTVGIVTGWRTEIAPESSLYNRLAEVEWHRPAGPIAACGGDMLLRSHLWQQVGGMGDDIICSEDEDLVIRVRQTGMTAHRIPLIMTRHDAAMTRLNQWWRRAVRTGHGFADVGHRHPAHFGSERRRTWILSLILPVMLLAGLLTGQFAFAVVALAGWGLALVKTALWLREEGLRPAQAAQGSMLFLLSRFANVLGMFTYWRRRLTRARMEIIEYK